MRKTALLVCLAGLGFSPVAAADSELYVTGGVALFDGEDSSINALNFRGGVEFNELLGAEFESSFGLGAEDVSGFSGAQVELENQFAAFFVGRYPVLPQTDILLRLGYSTGELQLSNAGVSQDFEIDGIAFGIGGEYMFTDTLGIRGDYTRIEADEANFDGGIDTFAISGVFKFGSLR